MDVQTKEPPKLPPVWFKHLFWRVHRFAYRLLGARVLWTAGRASAVGAPCTWRPSAGSPASDAR